MAKIPNVKTNHIGRKIERIRELRGIKQETLATSLGMTQQSVSKMENSEHVDDKKLERVAVALGVTAESIKNFNEEAILSLVQNNSDNSANNSLIAYQFNPMEKVTELYERLLESERKKNELLQALLKKNGEKK